MKIVFDTPTPTIHFNAVTDRLFFGVLHCNKHKGFIIREEYNAGRYIVSCRDSYQNGNRWTGFRSTILRDLLRELHQGDFELYAFKTETELFKWLSE